MCFYLFLLHGEVIVVLESSVVGIGMLFDLPQDVKEKINIKFNNNIIIFFISTSSEF